MNPKGQIVAHAPQFELSDRRDTQFPLQQLFPLVQMLLQEPQDESAVNKDSHPGAIGSQSAKSGKQVKLHEPKVQVAMLLGGVGQIVLQEPQLLTLFVIFVSQPAARGSQSANPDKHSKEQFAREQIGVLLGGVGQTLLQSPQLIGSEFVFVSQPRDPSQSLNPEEQFTVQTPLTQLAEEFGPLPH